MKLNALSQAFGRRSQEQATSHMVHKLSLGTFALESALERGSPFAAEARSLQQSCAEDPLVDAAVASVSGEASTKVCSLRGQRTQVHQQDRYPVSRVAICFDRG